MKNVSRRNNGAGANNCRDAEITNRGPDANTIGTDSVEAFVFNDRTTNRDEVFTECLKTKQSILTANNAGNVKLKRGILTGNDGAVEYRVTT